MGDKTGIQWCDSTWNPIVGCSIVSPGCTNCYAMGQAARIVRMAEGAGRQSHYSGTTQPSKAGAVWTGKLALAPDHTLTAPLRWKRPRRIFVNSMGDLFHEDASDEDIDRVFAVMALTPQHTYQILTKRGERMRRYLAPFDQRRADSLGAKVLELGYREPLELLRWPLPNVWLGVSAERQKEADERIPHLLATPAAIRFVSCEPLLGPISLTFMDVEKTAPSGFYAINALTGRNTDMGRPCRDVPHIDWVIVGGESGRDARPMHPDWARSLRDQCLAAGVAYFHKQNGQHTIIYDRDYDDPDWRRCDVVKRENPKGRWLDLEGGHGFHGKRVVFAVRVDKHSAGRLLDGREWNEFPATGETR